MKKDIHPTYYPSAKVRCACGNTFTVGSTKPEIQTEICSKCHPFYTGKEKLIDTAGKVEKFRARVRVAEVRSGEAKARLRGRSHFSEAEARRAKAPAAPAKPKKARVGKSLNPKP